MSNVKEVSDFLCFERRQVATCHKQSLQVIPVEGDDTVDNRCQGVLNEVGDVTRQRQRQTETKVVKCRQDCIAVDRQRVKLEQAQRRLQAGCCLTTETHTYTTVYWHISSGWTHCVI